MAAISTSSSPSHLDVGGHGTINEGEEKNWYLGPLLPKWFSPFNEGDHNCKWNRLPYESHSIKYKRDLLARWQPIFAHASKYWCHAMAVYKYGNDNSENLQKIYDRFLEPSVIQRSRTPKKGGKIGKILFLVLFSL